MPNICLLWINQVIFTFIMFLLHMHHSAFGRFLWGWGGGGGSALIVYISHVNNCRNTAAIEAYDTIGLCVENCFLSSFSGPSTARKSSVSELLDCIQIIKLCGRQGMSHRRTWNWNAVILRNQVKIAYLFRVWTYKKNPLLFHRTQSLESKKATFPHKRSTHRRHT